MNSQESQDIADFLSTIDSLTAAGGSGGSSGVGVEGGGDLIFGPTSSSSSRMGGGGNTEASGLAYNEGYGVEGEETPGWLKDLQALEMREGQATAATTATATPAKGIGYARRAEEHEILGVEPEILDREFFPNRDQHHNNNSNNRSQSIGGAIAGGERGEMHPGRAATATGWAHGTAEIAQSQVTTDRASATALASKGEEEREQQRLDWPGTLDMLGLTEADGQPLPTSNAAAASVAPSARITAGLPVSSLPAMPPPPPREASFPDFVEVKDPRHVSQWPKPSAASGVHAGGGGGGGSAGGSGEGGGGRAVGSEGAKQQQHQALPAPLRTVEVYLRPDVTWESVSDVYMAVMLSRGLVVRQQTEKMVTAEKAADSAGDWATVTLRVGVTRDKLRTLVMQFYADTRAPILSLAGTMARFSGRAGDELYSAIRDALVERRMPLSFLATDAREVSLDPHYVRDLVAMYARENVVNLTRYALPLEEFVRGEEERSARLEATLMPKYLASGLVPPRPTRSKLLSTYSLTTRRPPVASCGVEEAREVVERAREHADSKSAGKDSARDAADNSLEDGVINPFVNAGNSENESTEVSEDGAEAGEGGKGGGREEGAAAAAAAAAAEGIRVLIRATWEDVKEWCDEEAEARVRRKDSQVRDRLLAVERHREALVGALRDGAGGSAALSTPTGREFAARFRLMAEEAVLCECKAVHGKRVGQLYMTCNHLCFHSSVLGFTTQKVIPLLTVASVSRASSALPLGVDSVTVTDRGGELHSFGITAVEAGFPERFHDLLQQVLIMCKADASRRAAKEAATGGGVGYPTSKYNQPDEVQILARVQRLAKAKQLREAREKAAAAAASSSAAATTAAAAHTTDTAVGNAVVGTAAEPKGSCATPIPTVVNTDETQERRPPPPAYTREDDGPAAQRSSGGMVERETVSGDSTNGSRDEGRSGLSEAGESGGGAGGRGASMMAMGIQAFLEESQRKL